MTSFRKKFAKMTALW